MHGERSPTKFTSGLLDLFLTFFFSASLGEGWSSLVSRPRKGNYTVACRCFGSPLGASILANANRVRHRCGFQFWFELCVILWAVACGFPKDRVFFIGAVRR